MGDTFGFLRETGLHFFPTLLRTNFLYLLGMALFAYFAFSYGHQERLDFIPGIHGHLDWGGWRPIGQELTSQFGLTRWGLLGLSVCLGLLAVGALVFAAYTPSYMILYRREGRAPAFRTIVSFIRSRAGRLVVYFLGILLLGIPVVAVCVPLFILLVFSIVGIALIPFILLVLMMMSVLLLYAYLDDDKPGFFEAIDRAWNRLKSSFLQNIMCNGIIYIVTGLFGVIPSVVASVFDAVPAPHVVFIGMAGALVILVLHLIISSLYSVNIGLIYYSGAEKDQSFWDGFRQNSLDR